MTVLRIGIDFDNTIVCYDSVFHKVAFSKGLIPSELPFSKGAIRDYLRSQGQEAAWTELQGYVYGMKMDLAHPFSGVASFFNDCRSRQIATFIISHKTLNPFLGPKYDLHQAAKSWLQKQPFSETPAFFELTLEEKLNRIKKQECSVFIDDLPELLEEKNFPANVQKILFDPNKSYSKKSDYLHVTSWEEISNFLIRQI